MKKKLPKNEKKSEFIISDYVTKLKSEKYKEEIPQYGNIRYSINVVHVVYFRFISTMHERIVLNNKKNFSSKEVSKEIQSNQTSATLQFL